MAEGSKLRGAEDPRARTCLPLWEAPEAWLKLLDERLHQNELARESMPCLVGRNYANQLAKLMSTNWAMFVALLNCMDNWRLVIEVCVVLIVARQGVRKIV